MNSENSDQVINSDAGAADAGDLVKSVAGGAVVGRKRRVSSPIGQAVGGGDVDTVYLSKCVFKNSAARKSLSVHHVQRRLSELGYRDAYTDKDGWYGDLTKAAVLAYQQDCGIPGDGIIDAGTLNSLFEDDPNVQVSVE